MNKEALKETRSLASVAKECLEACGGDVGQACDRMVHLVHENVDLRIQLTDPLLASACYAVISKELRAERKVVWLAPNYDKAQEGGRLRNVAHDLLDFRLPVPGWTPLGEADKETVLVAAHNYEIKADDMSWKARWLRKIARKIKTGTVGEHLDEATLRKLQEDAK